LLCVQRQPIRSPKPEKPHSHWERDLPNHNKAYGIIDFWYSCDYTTENKYRPLAQWILQWNGYQLPETPLIFLEMQAFRKFGGSRAMQLAATWNKPVIIQSMKFRDMTFKPEEFTGAHDDDFHRTEEDIRQRKTMRANFMRIQALPENAYEKYVLQQMLSKINSIFNIRLYPPQ
jgi:hypothetical protein